MKHIRAAIQAVQRLIRRLNDHAVGAFSAQAAFFLLLSFFPFAMLFFTLVRYLPFSQEELSRITFSVLPHTIDHLISGVIGDIYDRASGTLVISLTAVVALWSAGKGVLSIIRGFNAVYGIRETRNYFKLRLISTFYTLVFLAILMATIVFLVFGSSLVHWIIQYIPALEKIPLLKSGLRAAVGLGILVLFFLLLYTFVPNRKTKLRRELPGALFCALGWVGFSFLYSFYMLYGASFTIYGSLTAVILFMLWLFICMYIMFIGGEINAMNRTGELRDALRKIRTGACG